MSEVEKSIVGVLQSTEIESAMSLLGYVKGRYVSGIVMEEVEGWKEDVRQRIEDEFDAVVGGIEPSMWGGSVNESLDEWLIESLPNRLENEQKDLEDAEKSGNDEDAAISRETIEVLALLIESEEVRKRLVLFLCGNFSF